MRDIYDFTDEEYYRKFVPALCETIAPLTHDSLILFNSVPGIPAFLYHLLKNGLSLRMINVWLYDNPRPGSSKDGPVVIAEPFLWFGVKGKKATYKSYRLRSDKKSELRGTNLYVAPNVYSMPQGKHEKLFERIIQEYGNPPVLDPMAGGLTTAVVCEKLEIPWVCIEIRKDIFDKAIRRIK